MTESKPWAAAAAALSPPFVPLTAALLPGSLGRLGAGCHALQGDMLSIMYPRPVLPACRGAWARTWAWRAQPWPLACRVLTSRSSWCWFSRCARRCGASAASAGRQLGCRARLLSAERLHRRRKTLRCAQSGLTRLQARQSGVDSQDGTAWRRRGGRFIEPQPPPLPAFQLPLACARLTHASESVYMGSNSNDIEQIKVQ